MSESIEIIESGTIAGNESSVSPSALVPLGITDGVYAIKNVKYPSRWMSMESGYPLGGDRNLQHTEYSASPTSTFERPALFKISKVAGTTNRYVIRSMVCNRISFLPTNPELTSTDFYSHSITSADESVPVNDTFYIEPTTGGFHIRSAITSSYIGISSATTSNLLTVSPSSADNGSVWTFEQYTGSHRNGFSLYCSTLWRSIGLEQGIETSATIISWSTHINGNTVYAALESGYEDLATTTWNETTRKFNIIPNNPGKLKFTARIRYPNNTTSIYIGLYTYTIVPKEGTYYLNNVGTGKYVDIEGPSKASGAKIQQWTLHSGTQEKWIVEHVANSNGYIRLKSAYSNLYMGIDSANTSLVKQYSTQDNYTLWLLDRTSADNLVLKCKATESSGVALSVPLNSNSNGTDLTQIAYTNDTNYRDEWELFIFKDASLIAVPESYDRSSFFAEALDDLETIGYTDNYDNHDEANRNIPMNDEELLARMRFSQITLVRTHGSGEVIAASNRYIHYSELQALPVNAFYHSELIIYGACETAYGGSGAQNFVNATYNQGVNIVIGFQESVYSTEVNKWCKAFFEALSNGNSVRQSCLNADQYIEDWQADTNRTYPITTDSWYIAGDGSTVFGD